MLQAAAFRDSISTAAEKHTTDPPSGADAHITCDGTHTPNNETKNDCTGGFVSPLILTC